MKPEPPTFSWHSDHNMVFLLLHHSNLGALAQLVKDNSRNYAQQTQQLQNLQSQMQLQQQAFIRQPQQVF